MTILATHSFRKAALERKQRKRVKEIYQEKLMIVSNFFGFLGVLPGSIPNKPMLIKT